MELIKRLMRSSKWKGLQIAVVKFEDGSQLLLTDKPQGGEQIEVKYRRIKKGVEKQNKSNPMPH